MRGIVKFKELYRSPYMAGCPDNMRGIVTYSEHVKKAQSQYQIESRMEIFDNWFSVISIVILYLGSILLSWSIVGFQAEVFLVAGLAWFPAGFIGLGLGKIGSFIYGLVLTLNSEKADHELRKEKEFSNFIKDCRNEKN